MRPCRSATTTIRENHEKMLTCTPYTVKKTRMKRLVITGDYEASRRGSQRMRTADKGETIVAEVKMEDGIIKIVDLDIQDPKVAKVLAEYPENRWCEITRRAIKIGLGYLQGGAQD